MGDPANAPAEFDSLWNYDDPAGSESKFRALLPQARESGNDAYLAELMTQIARNQGLQQKYADAHATLAKGRASSTFLPAVLERK